MGKKIYKIIENATSFLKQHNIKEAKFDAEILLSYVLNIEKNYLYFKLNDTISNLQYKFFTSFLERRAKKEPVAYIVGEKGFWSLNLKVNQNVLIPRPETEILVEKTLTFIKQDNQKILEIGTGSGAIILSLAKEKPKNTYFANDISKYAISCAKRNKERNKIKNELFFFISDVFSNLNKDEKFDIIVSNPPYIKKDEIKNLQDEIKYYEPLTALDGGKDGTSIIEKIIMDAPNHLKPNGVLLLEIGFDQKEMVLEIGKKTKFSYLDCIKDYSKNDRVAIMKLNN